MPDYDINRLRFCFFSNKIGIFEPNRRIIWRQQTSYTRERERTKKTPNFWETSKTNQQECVLQSIYQLCKQSIWKRETKEIYKIHWD